MSLVAETHTRGGGEERLRKDEHAILMNMRGCALLLPFPADKLDSILMGPVIAALKESGVCVVV